MPKIRYELIDFMRGLSVLAMIIYHFCFDLKQYGMLETDFNQSAFWLSARASIVSSFLFIMGMSLVLAKQQASPHYWRRMAILVVCAMLVTLGSKMMFPDSYIFFGILHFIALASLLGALLLRVYWVNLAAGLLLLLLGIFYQNAWFDQSYMQWLGLMTHKPFTEDYVPLLPWLGVVMLGVFAGQTFVRTSSLDYLHLPVSNGRRSLIWLGQHSLLVYMAHQPILLGILWLVFGR